MWVSTHKIFNRWTCFVLLPIFLSKHVFAFSCPEIDGVLADFRPTLELHEKTISQAHQNVLEFIRQEGDQFLTPTAKQRLVEIFESAKPVINEHGIEDDPFNEAITYLNKALEDYSINQEKVSIEQLPSKSELDDIRLLSETHYNQQRSRAFSQIKSHPITWVPSIEPLSIHQMCEHLIHGILPRKISNQVSSSESDIMTAFIYTDNHDSFSSRFIDRVVQTAEKENVQNAKDVFSRLQRFKKTFDKKIEGFFGSNSKEHKISEALFFLWLRGGSTLKKPKSYLLPQITFKRYLDVMHHDTNIQALLDIFNEEEEILRHFQEVEEIKEEDIKETILTLLASQVLFPRSF